ncbi:MAG: cellulase family glycosylhydrolase [Anaerolineae bacterium]|nr:cellulase family glycosylhydrolase [Anaerolineae bacterium]
MDDRKPSSLVELFKSKWAERLVDLVLVPALLIYSLWLPPAAIGIRLFHMDYPLITPEEGGLIASADGARIKVPAGAVAKRSRIKLEAFENATPGRLPIGSPQMLSAALGSEASRTFKPDSPEYLALQSLPEDFLVYGPVYRLDVRGVVPENGRLTIPVPYALATVRMADLYGWDGESWRWLPAQLTADSMTLVSDLEWVPTLFMITQAQNQMVRLGTTVTEDEAAQIPGQMPVSVVTVTGSTIASDGRLALEISAVEQMGLGGAAAASGAPEILLNVTNVLDGVVRNDLVDNLVIDPVQRQTHIAELMAAVSAGPFGGVALDYRAVDPELRAECTAFVSELAGALNSAGKTLAVKVDIPEADGESWDTGAYDWRALGQVVDKLRIPALPDPAAYAEGGEMDALLAWATGEVQRSKIELEISSDAHVQPADGTGALSYRDALSLFAQNVTTDDADRMLLPGESANLSSAALRGSDLEFDPDAQVYWFEYGQGEIRQTIWLENATSVARKLQYVNRYGLGGANIENALAEGNDQEIAQVVSSFQQNQAPAQPHFAFVWTVADAQGRSLEQQVMPLVNPDWVWTAPNNPGDYIIQASVSDDGGETNLGPAGAVSFQVPTPTFTPTPTPTNTPEPTATPTNTPEPTATPKPQPQAQVAAAPRVGGYFGYGIQADMVTDGNLGRIFDHVQGIGFNWVKQQVEWFRYNPGPGQYDWGALDRIVDAANARGVNVLFSVVKAPKWARPPGDTDEGPPADPNTYGAFMREMAARYKGRVKAYEIWNEQNLYYEWGGRGNKLNAARYVELLKVAYNAVKSVDPGAVVVSGALTPTGVNDGDTAIDDRVYLEQMYQAGLARYCDAVGAHPSGYNNPPDADWRNWSDASAPSFKGHPSFFYRGTMESYRNIMVKYGDGGKRVWPTEFGWASVEGLGVGPAAGYGYAADNTEAEQAQFIVRAYQMGRAWGWVGPMFLWNLNFAPVAGREDEKAAFGIVRHDWGPRQAFGALRDMPK